MQYCQVVAGYLVVVVIAGLANTTRADDPKAKDLLTEALAAVNKIGEKDRNDVRAQVVAWQARTGDMAGAAATTAMITEPLFNGIAYGHMADALVDAGDLDGARGLLPKVKNPGGLAAVHRSIAIALARKGDIKAAQTELTQINDDFYKNVTLEEMARAQTGDLKAAEATVALISAMDIRARAYTDVAIAVAKTQRPEVVRHWIDMAREAANHVEFWKSAAMAPIAGAEVYAGNLEAAHAILKDADAGTRSMIAGFILQAHLALGQIKEARAMREKMTEPDDQVNFAVNLGEALLHSGDRAGAEKAVQEGLALFGRVSADSQFIYAQNLSVLNSDINGVADGLKWAQGQRDAKTRIYALLGVISTLPEAKGKQPPK